MLRDSFTDVRAQSSSSSITGKTCRWNLHLNACGWESGIRNRSVKCVVKGARGLTSGHCREKWLRWAARCEQCKIKAYRVFKEYLSVFPFIAHALSVPVVRQLLFRNKDSINNENNTTCLLYCTLFSLVLRKSSHKTKAKTDCGRF